LFSRNVLNESVYKNIIAINDHDVKFLKAVGIYCLENFSSDISDILREAEYNSQLFQQLKKESTNILKGVKNIYWEQPEYEVGNDIVGYHVVSIDRDVFRDTQGVILTKYMQESHITLYLPLLDDWCRYYLRNGREGLGRRIILGSTIESLQSHKLRKLCIYNSSKEELVDRAK
jgi:hypothetical protein